VVDHESGWTRTIVDAGVAASGGLRLERNSWGKHFGTHSDQVYMGNREKQSFHRIRGVDQPESKLLSEM